MKNILLLLIHMVLVTGFVSYAPAEDTGTAKPAQKQDKIDESILDESTKEFDAKNVATEVRKKKLELDKCYNDELLKNKNLHEGEVRINFTITEKGVVTGAAIKFSAIKNKVVEDCMLGIISKLTFIPNPPQEIEVNYPFMISNKEKEAGGNAEKPETPPDSGVKEPKTDKKGKKK